MEHMLHLLHGCGLNKEDVDFINTDGKAMNKLLLEVGFSQKIIFEDRILKKLYFIIYIGINMF